MSTPSAPSLPRFSPALVAGLVILGGAALAYHNTFAVPWLFDDQASIPDNPTIRNLVTAWSPPDGGLTVSGRPFLNFTLAVNYAVSGLEVWSYHLVNLLIHVAAGCTLYGIVRRTLVGLPGVGAPLDAARGRPQGKPLRQDATWLALAVTLLWTLHPLQTQAVTYLIQRAESLVSLIYLLTLWCFIRAVEPGASKLWAGLAWIACLLGMATKEVMVTAPVMVALYDRIFVAGSWREVWARRKGFHCSLVLTWLLLGWLVWSAGGRSGTAGFGGGVSPWAYALTQIEAVAHYLRLAFWPQPLVFDYGQELARGWGDVWLSALVVFPLLAASIWTAGRGRAAGYLGVFFFAVLAPSSSFVPVITQTMSEHRPYLALAGVLVPVVLALYAMWGRLSLLVCGVVAAGLGLATMQRNHDYRTELALWEDTLLKRPDNPRALTTLGSLHEKENRLDLALPLLQRATEIAPDYVEAQNNLGHVWVRLNRPDRAAEHYRRALTTSPNQPTVWNNLGNALMATGREDEAIAALEQALLLKPDQTVTRSVLAALLARHGRFPEAEAHLIHYLKAHPDDAEAHGNYANVLLALSRPVEALAEFEITVRLRPGDASFRNQYGVLLARTGRLAEALVQFEEAVRLQPDLTGARQNAEQTARLLRAR